MANFRKSSKLRGRPFSARLRHMDDETLAATRRYLHGAAELLLAGPQHRATGRIDLQVVPGGFATAATPALRITGADLITAAGRVPLPGRSYADVATSAGIDAGPPVDVYTGGPGIGVDDVIRLDPEAVATLLSALAVGDRALRAFAAEHEPILWPEHFDVAVTVDEVNYGVSPGDGYSAVPYAYVGPFQARQGSFWNAPFGAARPVAELGDADAVVGFFQEGRGRSG
ncbi:MAG TPA: hypothetical protein VHV49_00215 [Pseudonocardiaceae bacterium]|nr:hypothetical protein [Pseudonocardiaceae bacterium]